MDERTTRYSRSSEAADFEVNNNMLHSYGTQSQDDKKNMAGVLQVPSRGVLLHVAVFKILSRCLY